MRTGGSIGIAIAIVVASHAARAEAPGKNDPHARADRLFDEGREAMAKKDFATACPKFEESQRLDPALGTLLNIGLCDEALGHIAEALAVWRQAEEQARGAGESKRAATAAEHVAALVPRVPTILVQAPLDDARVTLDDRPLARGQFDIAIGVDPGPHTVAATWPDAPSFSEPLTMREGERATITVHKPPPAPTATARRRRTPAYLVGGGGVVVLAAGAILGLTAKSKYDGAFNDGHCDRATLACDGAGQAATDAARSRGTIATVVGVVGLGAIVTGAILYVTAPSVETPRTTAIVPTASPDGAGLAIVGSF